MKRNFEIVKRWGAIMLAALACGACSGDAGSGSGGVGGHAGASGAAGTSVAGAAGSGAAGSGTAGSGTAGSGVAGSSVAGAAGSGVSGASGSGQAGRGGAGGGGGAGGASVAGTGGGSQAGGGGGGTPVVVAVGYGRRRLRSLDGRTWSLQELTPDGGDDNDLLRGVTWGNGRFVAVGGSTVGLTMTSPDGMAWTEGGTADAWIGGAAWTGTVFVAAGGNGLRMRSTDNGVTWTNRAEFQMTHYRAIAFGAGLVVAVGHSYDRSPNVGVIATTPDGITWTERRRSGGQFRTVVYGNGLFVAASEQSDLVATSPDGITWTDHHVGVTGGGYTIFTGTEFVLLRNEGNYRSSDGLQWTLASTDARFVMGYFNGAYLSFDWPLRVSTSPDLQQWTRVYEPLGSGVSMVAVGTLPR